MGANVDYKDLLRFSRRIAKLRTENKEKFFHEAAKMMAARLLALVIPRTPVGKGAYRTVAKTDKEGNTLRYVRGAKKGALKQKSFVLKPGVLCAGDGQPKPMQKLYQAVGKPIQL